MTASSRIDGHDHETDPLGMSTVVTVDARWAPEARVWTATSADVPGLVVEAETWPAVIDEVRLALPDLMMCDGRHPDAVSPRFRVERPCALSELLSGATPEAMSQAWDWGDDVGREVID